MKSPGVFGGWRTALRRRCSLLRRFCLVVSVELCHFDWVVLQEDFGHFEVRVN